MKIRKITEKISMLGAIDWNRRLFDSLIPLPDGTSYNSYLVEGSSATALIDTSEPALQQVFINQLQSVKKIDYIVSLHTEQDHSGLIPFVLQKHPNAIILASKKGKDLLIDHLAILADKIRVVEDGEIISLGDKSLKTIYTPWVHWPETMCVYAQEDKILFSCDLFGSHMATTDMYSGDNPAIIEAAKRYFAEIMMPFRTIVRNNVKKIKQLDIATIAPSHGPLHDQPQNIISAYEEWTSDKVSNTVVIPYISMHGSTEIMVNYLLSVLTERDIKVEKFELSTTDIGKLAMSLVDAATIVIGTPTVHVGPHPIVFNATHLANALRPKLKYAAIIGSYGWATKATDQIASIIPNLKVEVLDAIMTKGLPTTETFKALDALADKIKEKHSDIA